MRRLALAAWSLGAAGAILTGCAAARDHFYTVQALAPGARSAGAGPRTALSLSVRLPPALDRAAMVIHLDAHEVTVLEHERWLGLPSEQIESALGRDLELARAGLWVNDARAGDATLRVRVEVVELRIDADHRVHLEARWRIVTPGGADKLGEVLLVEPARAATGDTDSAYSAIAAALSREIAALAQRLIDDLPA